MASPRSDLVSRYWCVFTRLYLLDGIPVGSAWSLRWPDGSSCVSGLGEFRARERDRQLGELPQPVVPVEGNWWARGSVRDADVGSGLGTGSTDERGSGDGSGRRCREAGGREHLREAQGSSRVGECAQLFTCQ